MNESGRKLHQPYAKKDYWHLINRLVQPKEKNSSNGMGQGARPRESNISESLAENKLH
jgi:hypothetical protein